MFTKTKETKKVSKEIREAIKNKMAEGRIRQILKPQEIPDDKQGMAYKISVLILGSKIEDISIGVKDSISMLEAQIIYTGNGLPQNANTVGICNVLQINKEKLCNIISPEKKDLTKVLNGLENNKVDWSDINIKNIADIIVKVDKKYREKAAWYCSQKFYNDVLESLKFASGSDKKVKDDGFLGYPVKTIESMSKEYKAGEVCLLFGDINEVVTIYEGKDMEVGETIRKLPKIVTRDYTYNRYDIDMIYEIKNIEENGPIAGLIIKGDL